MQYNHYIHALDIPENPGSNHSFVDPLNYRGGPHMRSLIPVDFPAQKWNLKAHMWYQLSPFPSSNVAICDAATPREHSPILRYSALLRYSVLCLIQLPNAIDTISKRWRSKKAFNTSPSHIFS